MAHRRSVGTGGVSTVSMDKCHASSVCGYVCMTSIKCLAYNIVDHLRGNNTKHYLLMEIATFLRVVVGADVSPLQIFGVMNAILPSRQQKVYLGWF